MGRMGLSRAACILAIGVVAALVLMGTAMGEVSREGLVGEWHFDGNAQDTSGNGNHGTIYGGAAFVDGVHGRALSFDGVDDYVTLGVQPELEPTTISVSVWVKFRRTGDLRVIIDSSHGGDDTKGWVLQQYPGEILFGYGSSSNTFYGAGTSSNPGDNNWHQLVGTFDGVSEKIYLDGVLSGADTYVGTPVPSGRPINIGYWYHGSRYFNGLIDEVRIYNRALSADEIKANYEADKTPLSSQSTPIPTTIIPAGTPAAQITINSPRNNENINWSPEGYLAKGSFTGTISGLKTYILVHPLTITKWWVQRAPTISGSNWESVVYLGTKDVGANENYEIYVIVTDKTLNEGMELGALPDYSAMARVTVFRPAQSAPPVTPALTTVSTATPESSNSYIYAGIGGIVLLLVGITALKRRSSSHKKEPLKPLIAVRPISQKPLPEHKEAAPELRPTAVSKTEAPRVEPALHVAPVSGESGVDVKTAFGYKGAAIIYKLKIENNTSDPISDIKVYPYIPDVFLLREKEKSISLIEPKSSQTVTFEIRPTGECGDCNVSGRVNYYDMASRKRQDIELEPKSLSIVCPMLHGKEISEAEWHDTVSNLVKTEESTKEIDMPAETLFTMVSRIIKDMHMYMQKPEITQDHKLFNGVARFYGEGVKGLRYAAQVEVVGGTKKARLILKAWAEKEDALTGFYHGILDEIDKRVDVKGYIEDSIVQYNIHIGDRIGTKFEGDVVAVRSSIGAGTKKCSDCGREVEANEKFCLECGAKLR